MYFRGTSTNLAYVFTRSPKRADPAPRPAPELDRYDQIHAERTSIPAPATPPAPPGEPLAVLSAGRHPGQQYPPLTQAQPGELTLTTGEWKS